MIFQLWGPKVTTVEIAIGGERIPMSASPSGWWTVDVPASGVALPPDTVVILGAAESRCPAGDRP